MCQAQRLDTQSTGGTRGDGRGLTRVTLASFQTKRRKGDESMAVIGIDVSKQKLDCAWLRDAVSGKAKTRVLPDRRQDFPTCLNGLSTRPGSHRISCMF